MDITSTEKRETFKPEHWSFERLRDYGLNPNNPIEYDRNGIIKTNKGPVKPDEIFFHTEIEKFQKIGFDPQNIKFLDPTEMPFDWEAYFNPRTKIIGVKSIKPGSSFNDLDRTFNGFHHELFHAKKFKERGEKDYSDPIYGTPLQRLIKAIEEESSARKDVSETAKKLGISDFNQGYEASYIDKLMKEFENETVDMDEGNKLDALIKSALKIKVLSEKEISYITNNK